MIPAQDVSGELRPCETTNQRDSVRQLGATEATAVVEMPPAGETQEILQAQRVGCRGDIMWFS